MKEDRSSRELRELVFSLTESSFLGSITVWLEAR